MGLDMYLKATRYIGNWDHTSESERARYRGVTEAIGFSGFSCPGSPHLVVDLSVAYWRKANQIHAWFVEHVQDGEDECREHSVSKEQLQTLCDLCQQVLDTKNASLLPPRPGFFFGSTDIDDYYWQDLKYTIDQLKPLLEDPRFQGWDFTYQSSW